MMTADEIRARILEVVGKNGGHLASSLGAVEIAMALADVFDPEKDRIVWDVGHQAYAWKLLTDRGGKSFDTLRLTGGISPFPNPAESAADAAVAGHAGAALSVAAGLAAARDRKGTDERVVAVIGDASIVNGTSLEALNNIGAATKRLIIVLNDNEMSISRPVGSIAKMLGRLISSVSYNRVKTAAERVGHRLGLTFMRSIYHRVESRVKSWFLGNAFFEQFGVRYMGPVDGHDLEKLKAAFTVARDDKRSVLVHVVTKKGKGHPPAESNPTAWHGVSPSGGGAKKPGWSDTFGGILTAAARRDSRIVALTAAMRDGTGLTAFAKEFPDRFFDVGISEGHMVAFAAGLAAGGMRPVVAVYSTFLQRAVDQVMHDVCISKLPVVFCVDRAGVVGQDGATHQGVFDIAMLRCLPNLTIVQPCNAVEFERLFREAMDRDGPTVIRYPRGVPPEPTTTALPDGLAVEIANPDAAVQIWATGDMLEKALAVSEKTGAGVVYARSIKPFDENLLRRQRAAGRRIVSLENGSVEGGFGEAIGADTKFGWPDKFVPHGKVAELEKLFGLDVDAIKATVNRLKESKS